MPILCVYRKIHARYSRVELKSRAPCSKQHFKSQLKTIPLDRQNSHLEAKRMAGVGGISCFLLVCNSDHAKKLRKRKGAFSLASPTDRATRDLLMSAKNTHVQKNIKLEKSYLPHGRWRDLQFSWSRQTNENPVSPLNAIKTTWPVSDLGDTFLRLTRNLRGYTQQMGKVNVFFLWTTKISEFDIPANCLRGFVLVFRQTVIGSKQHRMKPLLGWFWENPSGDKPIWTGVSCKKGNVKSELIMTTKLILLPMQKCLLRLSVWGGHNKVMNSRE